MNKVCEIFYKGNNIANKVFEIVTHIILSTNQNLTMRGLNKVTLIGNLGKDPDVQSLEKNIKVAKFTLATTETFKDDKGQVQSVTDWHNIVLWRGLAELTEKYLHKGSLVFVEGKLKTRSYDDKEGHKKFVTEVVAEQIILLDKKTEGGNER